jgi:hypothetical protein
LVDHTQYRLYKILIDYLQDFFSPVGLVGFFGFFGIVYLRLLESGCEYLFSSFPSVSCTNLLLGGNWFPSFVCLPIVALAIVLSLNCYQLFSSL